MSNPVKPGAFCWNELMTNDIQEAKTFYSKLFGWGTHDHDMEGFSYTLFKNGDQDVGGMMRIPEGHEKEIPPHWMSYVYVTNVEETVQKARSLGATIKQEPMDVGDFGRLAVLQDPTGAHIAIWQQTKES